MYCPPESRCCGLLLGTVQYMAERFGISLAADKTEGPATELFFLGITIDSLAMECRLPVDKLVALWIEVSRASGLHKLCLPELQSLLGKLKAEQWGDPCPLSLWSIALESPRD